MKRLLLLLPLLCGCGGPGNQPGPPAANVQPRGVAPAVPELPIEAPAAEPQAAPGLGFGHSGPWRLPNLAPGPLRFSPVLADHAPTAAAVQWLAANFADEPAAALGQRHVRALALVALAFASAGQGRQGEDGKRSDMLSALNQLRRCQQLEGTFCDADDKDSVLVTALAALALGEIDLRGKSRFLRPELSRAWGWLLAARSPGSGWGSRAGAEPDLWHTTWALMALTYVPAEDEAAATEVAQARSDAAAFANTVAGGPGAKLRADGWMHWETSGPMADALWLLCCQLCGASPREPGLAERASRLCRAENLPDRHADSYYWLVGTLAIARAGGGHWKTWRKSLYQELWARQVGMNDAQSGPASRKGCWEPVGQAAAPGGPLEATALALLALRTGCPEEVDLEEWRRKAGLWYDAAPLRRPNASEHESPAKDD